MPLWKKTDDADGAPKFVAWAANGAIANAIFGNTVVGVFGVDATEAALAGKGITPGWVLVHKGTGPVITIEITDGGVLYANTDTLFFSGGGGTGAAGTLVTDANGVITAVTLTLGGSGYTSAPTLVANTVTGNNATFTVTVGGRAGRVTRENLVACRITTDAEDTVFPDA